MWGGETIQSYPVLCENYLPTCWAVLNRNNCIYFGPLFLADLPSFSDTGGLSINRLFTGIHSILRWCKSVLWLGHFKTFILFLLTHSEVDLLVCCPAAEPKLRFRFRSQTDGQTFSLMIFWLKARSWNKLYKLLEIPLINKRHTDTKCKTVEG